MAENKNQISAQEWSERMRSGGRRSGSAPSINRNPVGASGALTQMRNSLTSLNKQRLALSLGNIRTQYDLAERMANLTQSTNANAIARKERLYADRQANMNRMAQLYGQYYQQFGNVLNKDALDFLNDHSSISAPTLTAIMAGYEHARASRAQQRLTMLDRTAKMAEAEAALTEKQVALENERAANDQYANLQRLEAQSKAAQATYDAQKAFLDEQAKNEMIGAGLVGGGRGGTGVRALPGVGGAGGGARVGAANPEDRMRVPGNTVTQNAVTGTVTTDENGNAVGVDANGNTIGPVVRGQDGRSVVLDSNGNVAGTVDNNGNVIQQVEREAGPYEQYLAASGGYSDPLTMLTGAVGISAGLGALGESARLGYVNPDTRSLVSAYDQSTRALRSSARNVRNANFALRASVGAIDHRSVTSTPVMENYLRQLDLLDRQGVQLDPARRQALDNYRQYQNAKNVYLRDAAFQRTTRAGSLSALGGREGLAAAQNTVQRANNAGRIARATGAVSRFAGRYGGGNLARGLARRALTRVGTAAAAGSVGGPGGTALGTVVGLGLTALDLLPYAPGLAVGAYRGVTQGVSNLFSSGSYSRDVANAIASGEPIPVRPSAWSAFREGLTGTNQYIGALFGYDRLMRNPQDVDNFAKFYEQRTGGVVDDDTRIMFDNQPDAVRVAILDGMLTNNFTKPEEVREFIDNVIATHSTPEEQRIVQEEAQQVINQAKADAVRGSKGDHIAFQLAVEDLQNVLQRIGYDFDYEDVADAADVFTNLLGYFESRNQPGKEGDPTSNGTAKSIYQFMDKNFDAARKRWLKAHGESLSEETRRKLIEAKDANDLDTDEYRPLLAALVLDNIHNNLAINNEKFDKKGPNIRSDQMFGDFVSMVKMKRDAGGTREDGSLALDPYIISSAFRLGAVNHMRSTTQKNVEDYYKNGNNAANDLMGAFNRDTKGNNVPWLIRDYVLPSQYGQVLGVQNNVPVSTTSQQAGYGFDVAPGVDVDNLNTLLLQRFSAANDAMVSATGVKGRINSGKRSPSKQADLYRNREKNRNPVARSGWSKHEAGVALDFNNDEWENAFNGSDQLKHDYGTFDNFLKHFGIKRGVTDKNGNRSDLVHLTMEEDDEYHNAIDHDRLMASRGKWGDQSGNHWMRGVGERPKQVQPAWDVTPQFMVENFGYPQTQPMFYGEGEPFYDEMEENMAYLDDPNMYYDAGYVVGYDESGNPIFQ